MHSYICDVCDIAYRIRQNKISEVLDDECLFNWRDVLGITPKSGGAQWYNRPVLLKPEAMKRAGITVNLINQVFFAVGGSGVFPHNPMGMIDGYLVSQPKKEYTFFRGDFYGVPNDAAVERYYSLYRIKISNKQ